MANDHTFGCVAHSQANAGVMADADDEEARQAAIHQCKKAAWCSVALHGESGECCVRPSSRSTPHLRDDGAA